jgi:hypothetical protein
MMRWARNVAYIRKTHTKFCLGSLSQSGHPENLGIHRRQYEANESRSAVRVWIEVIWFRKETGGALW